MGWKGCLVTIFTLAELGALFVMKREAEYYKRESTFPRSSLHYINTVNGIVMVYENSGQTTEVAIDGKVWF